MVFFTSIENRKKHLVDLSVHPNEQNHKIRNNSKTVTDTNFTILYTILDNLLLENLCLIRVVSA